MHKTSCTLLFVIFTIFLGSQQALALPTVESVELESYLGLWYESARLPNSFQDKDGEVCYNSTAEYSLNSNGTLKVTNRCAYISEQGQLVQNEAVGVAFIEKGTNNSKLKVSLIPGVKKIPFLNQLLAGSYQILELGPVNESGEYSWVVVGSPRLFRPDEIKLGWILSRDPSFNTTLDFQDALDVLSNLGVSPSELVTRHL